MASYFFNIFIHETNLNLNQARLRRMLKNVKYELSEPVLVINSPCLTEFRLNGGKARKYAEDVRITIPLSTVSSLHQQFEESFWPKDPIT
jgi:hypothetical protein